MRAGALRHRVTLQQLVQSDGALGEVVMTWTPVAAVWAQIRALSGREWYEAQQLPEGAVTTEIIIRYRPGVTRTMRVAHGAQVYDVVAVLDREGRQRELVLMCREGV